MPIIIQPTAKQCTHKMIDNLFHSFSVRVECNVAQNASFFTVDMFELRFTRCGIVNKDTAFDKYLFRSLSLSFWCTRAARCWLRCYTPYNEIVFECNGKRSETIAVKLLRKLPALWELSGKRRQRQSSPWLDTILCCTNICICRTQNKTIRFHVKLISSLCLQPIKYVANHSAISSNQFERIATRLPYFVFAIFFFVAFCILSYIDTDYVHFFLSFFIAAEFRFHTIHSTVATTTVHMCAVCNNMPTIEGFVFSSFFFVNPHMDSREEENGACRKSEQKSRSMHSKLQSVVSSWNLFNVHALGQWTIVHLLNNMVPYMLPSRTPSTK